MPRILYSASYFIRCYPTASDLAKTAIPLTAEAPAPPTTTLACNARLQWIQRLLSVRLAAVHAANITAYPTAIFPASCHRNPGNGVASSQVMAMGRLPLWLTYRTGPRNTYGMVRPAAS